MPRSLPAIAAAHSALPLPFFLAACSDDAEWAAFDKPADAGDASASDFTNFGDVQAGGGGAGDSAADGGFAFVEATGVKAAGDGDENAEAAFDPFANFGAAASASTPAPATDASGGEPFDPFASFGS